MTAPLRVLMVTSELSPVAKAGGLGDMVAGLAKALRLRGVDIRIVLPAYGWIQRTGAPTKSITVPMGPRAIGCAVVQTTVDDIPVYLIEHNALFDRPHIYGPGGGDYADNWLRFSLLTRSAIEVCNAHQWWPGVFHAHDWPTALLPVQLNTYEQPMHEQLPPVFSTASVLTIHNLAHQGRFDVATLGEIGIAGPTDHLGLRDNNTVSFLRGGVLHSTLLTTVSPTYAREIQTLSGGEGMDDILRSRKGDLFGVLNGIDEELWNPRNDPYLPAQFSERELMGKQTCKHALQREAQLPQRPEVPVLGMVARLTTQKGVDLLASIGDKLLENDVQLIILGKGQPWAEKKMADLAAQYPQRCKAWITYDERRAHLVEAGSDFFLMPSRWEPCGLNQMYSMRYGTIPIVRGTGGLEDTVFQFDETNGTGTGFKFYDPSPEAFLGAIGLALRTYRENKPALRAIIQQAMLQEHGWSKAAASYEYFYRLAQVRKLGH